MRELGTDGADVTIVDMEAGLEHLKRGTPRHTDVLLVIAEPFYRSLETASATATLGRELGIPSVGIVANKVRDDQDEEWVRRVFDPRGIPVFGMIPFDPAVVSADRVPAAPIDLSPDAPAVRAVEAVADALAEGAISS